MTTGAITYLSEISLISDLCLLLEKGETPWGNVQISREFGFINGRTDVIAIDSQNSVLAFEVKLGKWRKALNQAYRNTSFAKESYVVLPEYIAQNVQKYTAEFYRCSVGLCAATPNKLKVLISAHALDPIQPWITEAAIAHTKKVP
jgi:hypothetical protein